LESDNTAYLEEQSDALKEIECLTGLVHDRDCLIKKLEFDLNSAVECIHVSLTL